MEVYGKEAQSVGEFFRNALWVPQEVQDEDFPLILYIFFKSSWDSYDPNLSA